MRNQILGFEQANSTLAAAWRMKSHTKLEDVDRARQLLEICFSL
jgi:hypothetical protein